MFMFDAILDFIIKRTLFHYLDTLFDSNVQNNISNRNLINNHVANRAFMLNNSDNIISSSSNNNNINNNANTNNNTNIPIHLQNFIKENLKDDCPICFTNFTSINKDDIIIRICGHIFCKTCNDKIAICATCRK